MKKLVLMDSFSTQVKQSNSGGGDVIMLWFLLPFVILVVVIFRHFKRRNGPYKSFYSLPGPSAWPLIGKAKTNIY